MNMNTQQLIITAIVGIVAGWLASIVVGGPGGLIGYLITGLIGAFVGDFVLSAAGWKPNLGNECLDAIVDLGDRRDHRRHPGAADHLSAAVPSTPAERGIERVAGERDGTLALACRR